MAFVVALHQTAIVLRHSRFRLAQLRRKYRQSSSEDPRWSGDLLIRKYPISWRKYMGNIRDECEWIIYQPVRFRNEGTGMRGISLAKCSAMIISRPKLNVFTCETTILMDRPRNMLHHPHHESPTNHLIQSNAHTTALNLALNMGAVFCMKQGVRDRRSEQRSVPKGDFMRNVIKCN